MMRAPLRLALSLFSRVIVASQKLVEINSRNNRIGRSSELENESLLDVFLVFFFFGWFRENLERLVAIFLHKDYCYNEQKERAKAGNGTDNDGHNEVIFFLFFANWHSLNISFRSGIVGFYVGEKWHTSVTWINRTDGEDASPLG